MKTIEKEELASDHVRIKPSTKRQLKVLASRAGVSMVVMLDLLIRDSSKGQK